MTEEFSATGSVAALERVVKARKGKKVTSEIDARILKLCIEPSKVYDIFVFCDR
jgi:hypothetical protein